MSGKRSEKHGERGSENVGNDNWERAHVTPPYQGWFVRCRVVLWRGRAYSVG